MAVFWYWRKLNLAICTCNCTYDEISFTVWCNHCAFSACIAYASSPSPVKWERKLLRSKAASRLPCSQKYLEPNHREELNCVQERTSTEDLYDAAVIRRSAVVGHVPRNMSASCVLLLRWNHLRLVLFTRVQSCHEKSGRARLHCVYARVGGISEVHRKMASWGDHASLSRVSMPRLNWFFSYLFAWGISTRGYFLRAVDRRYPAEWP